MIRSTIPVVSVVILGFCLSLAAALIWAMLQFQPPRPAVLYRYPVVSSGAASFCPGDVMSYSQQATITDAPASLRIIRTVWSESEEHTVIWDESPEWANYAEPTVVRQVSRYTIPPLPPGSYELRISATGETWRTAMFTIPFVVRAECP